MNPITALMPLKAKVQAAIVAAVLLLAVGAGAGVTWWITSITHGRDVAQLKQSHADDRAQWEADKAAISKQAQQDTAAAINRMKAAQDALALLDATKSKELADAERENNDLRADVAAGNKRVRVLAANLATAELAARQRATSGGTSASGVGNGAALELSAAAGQRVLDLRAGIIRDHAKIDYLQGYIRDVVKECKR